jgi:hypothetical protein
MKRKIIHNSAHNRKIYQIIYYLFLAVDYIHCVDILIPVYQTLGRPGLKSAVFATW